MALRWSRDVFESQGALRSFARVSLRTVTAFATRVAIMLWNSTKTEEPTGVPDRNQRQACWDARDKYFGCLERNKIVVPGQEEGKTCKAENVEYSKLCAASWVSLSV